MQQLRQNPSQTREEMIAARAYEKWKQRGCPLGDSKQDWFAARAEIDAEMERRAYEQSIAMFD